MDEFAARPKVIALHSRETGSDDLSVVVPAAQSIFIRSLSVVPWSDDKRKRARISAIAEMHARKTSREFCLLAGRRGDRPDAELAVCFIAARTVTVTAATAGIAVSGVAVVIGVAVEVSAEGFSKIVVEFVSEVVNLVDQVQQMLRSEGICVEHRGDQQVIAAESEAQARPFLREFDQPSRSMRGIAEAGQDRGPDVDLGSVIRNSYVDDKPVNRHDNVAVVIGGSSLPSSSARV
ncbi:hypothetical protein EN35_28845 [Rhodococcus qingshengii]|nr:hypothetical protein EN35_28845 [Rhodococcus qingshengii]